MSKSLGGWIHSFAVTETNTHKKGYTIYKIASIVFPREVPEALTCITVWKRFREVKRLYRELSKRHKSLHLRGNLPEPKDPGFFKRFEPEVIRYRKEYILQLLDFAAQHPALYKSHPFLSFFENNHTPNNSPIHKSNIETICDSLDLPFESSVDLIDPRKDNQQSSVVECFPKESKENNEDTSVLDYVKPSQIDIVTHSSTETVTDILKPFNESTSDFNDYIYEAAYEFSQAVQAEVNQQHRKAYEKYQAGIDKLLSGSKNDTNDDRKSIAKAKVTKYLSRADEMYQKYILDSEDDDKKTIQLSFDVTDSSEKYLERQWNQLSKFKVMKIIDSVMQVQDITDKCIYIMKAIEKPSSNSSAQSIFLPQNVPYMVNLIGFFQSSTTIFLLLQQAKGGKLFDYIQTYTPSNHSKTTINEIFPDIDHISSDTKNLTIESNQFGSALTSYDSGFVELQNTNDEVVECKVNTDCAGMMEDIGGVLEYEKREYIPPFDILSQDMDANDLVRCSQKLLRSVSNTLEQFKEIDLYSKKNEEINAINNHILPTIKISDDSNSKDKSEIEDYFEKSVKSNSQNRTPIKKQIILPETSVKQWAKELIVAISSLHLKSVILGDLYPNNILLGSKGQLLLSYFHKSEALDSISQVVINQNAVEGLYVSPERPFTPKSDWWTFGVILFELLTGYAFKSCHPSGLSSYYEIQFPESVDISDIGKDLLNGVLQYNPEFRFNEDQIKSHAFFDGTIWDEVAKEGVNSI